MTRSLVVALLAVSVLAGCGSEVGDLLSGDTCTSNPAKTQVSKTSCTLAPGPATINITLCSLCNDSSASCPSPSFLSDGTLELAPVVKQCQSSSQGCTGDMASGCNAAARQASCSVQIPATSGTIRMAIAADTLIQGNISVQSGGPSTCTL